jgi:hypothetical protein
MSALLVLTAGQTDVQLVDGAARRELEKKKCALLHDEIERRAGEWRLVDSPSSKLEPAADSLPQGTFILCTPKLDAVLRYLAEHAIALTEALILETRRDAQAERSDPRFAGTILATRLRERGVANVQQVTFLAAQERLEDSDQPRDAIIRRAVVNRIDGAVRDCLSALNPARVIVATTGGFPVVGNLVEEMVRLYAVPAVKIDLLEVPESAKAAAPMGDRAVSRQQIPEPAASYQARRHALELMDKGNPLGAWGAVQHLNEDEVERRWTRVVEWLACFAASMPMPKDCDIPLLTDPRMAARAGLRVELALRAGDIPRAVHGTVAFFESALWDHLGKHLTRHDDPKKRRLYKMNPAPDGDLVRRKDKDMDRPFEVAEEADGACWYKVFDDDVCGVRLAKRYLRQESLQKFGQSVSGVRDLRNDVAHNEPTPQLMDEARDRMIKASLWSAEGRFLSQPLVQSVLRDLGEQYADRIFTSLVSTVRARLLDAAIP